MLPRIRAVLRAGARAGLKPPR